LRAWRCPTGRRRPAPPDLSRGCSQSAEVRLGDLLHAAGYRTRSTAAPACRCSQVSGWRGRAPRCSIRSSGLVIVPCRVVPGRWPARRPRPPGSPRTRPGGPATRSGCAVTFSRGTSVTTPCSTPRNPQIWSSVPHRRVRPGHGSAGRAPAPSGTPGTGALSCSQYRPSLVVVPELRPAQPPPGGPRRRRPGRNPRSGRGRPTRGGPSWSGPASTGHAASRSS